MDVIQPTHALPAASLSDMARSRIEQDQLSLHKRLGFEGLNPWFLLPAAGVPLLGGMIAGLWDAFGNDKRDLDGALRDHWFAFRVNEDDLEMKDVVGLDGLMAKCTGDGTAVFGAPGWSHDVKGNWTFKDVATTDGILRGEFAFFLPKSKVPAQLVTSRSIPVGEDPKVEAEFLMPSGDDSEEVKEAVLQAMREMGRA